MFRFSLHYEKRSSPPRSYNFFVWTLLARALHPANNDDMRLVDLLTSETPERVNEILKCLYSVAYRVAMPRLADITSEQCEDIAYETIEYALQMNFLGSVPVPISMHSFGGGLCAGDIPAFAGITTDFQVVNTATTVFHTSDRGKCYVFFDPNPGVIDQRADWRPRKWPV
jgi:hypothetical protein